MNIKNMNSEIKILWRMIWLPLMVVLLCSGCYAKHTKDGIEKARRDSLVTDSIERMETEGRLEMNFLGHYIKCWNMDLPKELVKICDNDENMSFDTVTHNLKLYGTEFRLNMDKRDPHLMFVSSVKTDSKEMQKVIDAFDRFYGGNSCYEPENYTWPNWDSISIRKRYPYIKLRRVHTEDGGTMIIVGAKPIRPLPSARKKAEE